MRGRGKLLAIASCAALAGGCATSPIDGTSQPTLPKPVSALYSQMNMTIRMLIMRDAPRRECIGRDCLEQRVRRLAPRMAEATYLAFPEFACQVSELQFVVADKAQPSVMSNSVGRIVIMRPVESLAQTDAALAFVMAREIGHIVALHHESNAAYGMLISGITRILLPISSLAKLLSDTFATGTTTATLAAGSASTATSTVGSHVAVDSRARSQQDEADDYGLRIVARMGYDARIIAQAFGKAEPKPANDWVAQLNATVERLTRVPEQEPALMYAAQKAAECNINIQQAEPQVLGMR